MDVRIVTPFDPITSPYADIFNSLEPVGRHVFMDQLEQGILPYLRLAGESEWLGLPVTSHQVAAVQAKFPASIVPHDAITVDNSAWDDMFDWHESTLPYILCDQLDRSCHAELSHLVIDTTGDASLWRPQQPPPGTFGSLVILLPSYVEGGDVSFAYEHRVEKWHGSRTPWSALSFAAFYNSTAMHMAPILTGHVVGLVYNLVGSDVSTPVVAPSLPVAAIDALSALAQVATPTSPVLGLHVDLKIDAKLRDLRTRDLTFLIALLATDAYDVVFAQVHVGENGPSLHSATPCSSFPHNVAAYIEEGNYVMSPHFVNGLPLHQDNEGATKFKALLFWPKVARLTHFHWFFSSKRKSDLDDFLFPGLKDERAKLAMAVDVAAYVPMYAFSLEALGTRLTALGNLDLIRRFLMSAIYDNIRFQWSTTFAPLIAVWLQRFGPVQLGTTLIALMTPLPQEAQTTCITRISLLASLAGATTTPICDAVTQPFMRDLILACANALLNGLVDATLVGSDIEIRHAIELDVYLRSAPSSASSWLAHRVSPPLAETIEAFLRPPSLSAVLCASWRRLADQPRYRATVLRTVVAAIAPLLAQDPVKPDVEPFVSLVKYLCTTMDGEPFAGLEYDSDLYAALVVLHFAKCLTNDVVPGFCNTSVADMVPAVRNLTAATPNLTLEEMLVLAKLVTNSKFYYHHRQMLLEVLQLLHDMAPARAISFTRKWLKTRSDMAKAMQDVVYPLLLHSRDALPRRVVELMADACLGHFRSHPIVDDPMPVEELRLPACCRWCTEFNAFLQSPTQERYRAVWTDDDVVCPNVFAFAEAHHDRFKVDDPVTSDVPTMTANLEAWRIAALPAAMKRKHDAIDA